MFPPIFAYSTPSIFASTNPHSRSLTVESLPVLKRPEAVPLETPLAARSSVAWTGTAVGNGAQECFKLISVEIHPAIVILGLFSIPIFEDQGDGTEYADEICVTDDDEGSVIEGPLNAATCGLFLFGILSTTIDGSKGPPDYNEGIRFSNQNPVPWQNQLVLVPTVVPALGRGPPSRLRARPARPGSGDPLAKDDAESSRPVGIGGFAGVGRTPGANRSQRRRGR